MEDSGLKLVVAATGPDRPGPERPHPGPALVLALAVLSAALAATLLGADRGRRPIDSREIAQQTILRAIEFGTADPEVRRAMLTLRRELGRRPMDARTRAVYATFILGVSRGPEDAQAAVFHAERAAELAPVTVPVIRYSVQVLVRAGETERALALVREMFRYDTESAAMLLLDVEPMLEPETARTALIGEPEAWLAWSVRLERQGRRQDSDLFLGEAVERWPGDLDLLREAASRAHAAGRWDELGRLLPRGRALPREAAASVLYGYRASLEAERGDERGARQDLETALSLDDGADTLLVAAGVLEALGEIGSARDMWTRALYKLPPGRRFEARLHIMVRLARLEDREGSPASALRTWRSILEIVPDHAEARRRVDELAGFRREGE